MIETLFRLVFILERLIKRGAYLFLHDMETSQYCPSSIALRDRDEEEEEEEGTVA